MLLYDRRNLKKARTILPIVKNIHDSYWFYDTATMFVRTVKICRSLYLKQEKVKLRCLYTCENDVVRTITCFVLLRQREREREREREDHTCYK